MLNLSKYLEPGEGVLKRYYPIWFNQAGAFLAGGFFWAAALFLLWPLLKQGDWGIIGLILLAILGSYFLLRARLLWRGTCLVLTDKRLIDINRAGLFKEIVSQVAYLNLEDISWSKPGLLARLFDYGTVTVSYSRGSIKLNFSHMKNPKELASQLISRQKIV
ncbi:MAG: hypothetical protein ACOZAJ_01115 [Patescibacteria group bacterium]